MRLLALVALAVVVAGCGGKSKQTTTTGANPKQPAFVVGAVEDATKSTPGAVAKTAAAGFGADVLSEVWKPGASGAVDARALEPVAKALDAKGVEPVLAVYQFSSATPLDDANRQAFAAYAAALVSGAPQVHTVIVGNEPNLNLFWMPQFDNAGGDAAASSYERLLAVTYDALKAVSADVTVVGGALAPRGGDDPSSSRQTHSPTAFIRDLGAVYRARGRTKPLMDELSVHVYGESPRVPPTLAHPHTTSIGIADYPKLVGLVRDAFGKLLPIVYGEYGVETAIPPAESAHYAGHEVVQPVDEQTQARYYAQAIGMASCQPDVKAIYLFHVFDEPALAGLQSGVYYADGRPKSSLPAVRHAIEHPRCRR